MRSDRRPEQDHGYSFWAPLTEIGAVSPTRYDFRSGLGAHITACFDFINATSDEWSQWNALIAEHTAMRHYFTGDFFPLTEYSVASDVWMAWQFHRPDLGEGLVQAFRRPDSPADSAVYRLSGLKADAEYFVSNLDAADSHMAKGEQLMQSGLPVHLPTIPSAGIFVYREVPRGVNAQDDSRGKR